MVASINFKREYKRKVVVHRTGVLPFAYILCVKSCPSFSSLKLGRSDKVQQLSKWVASLVIFMTATCGPLEFAVLKLKLTNIFFRHVLKSLPCYLQGNGKMWLQRFSNMLEGLCGRRHTVYSMQLF